MYHEWYREFMMERIEFIWNTKFKEFHLALYIFFINSLIDQFQNIGCYDLMKYVYKLVEI
jgi:hypothetical protein